jgi:transketolase
MALNAKLDQLPYRTFVLLGDSEMAEGSVWEAMACAAHYKLNNLVAILDVNRLGQRGETMLGHHTEVYQKRAEAFGWETITIDGHDMEEIINAFIWACGESKDGKFQISNDEFLNKSQIQNSKPKIIIAKTLKGKGVSFMEDKDGWHGRALTKEELKQALEELGQVDKSLVGEIEKPNENSNIETRNSKQIQNSNVKITEYKKDKPVATRKAYGNALVNIMEAYPNAVVLDAETSNSTYSEFVKKTHPERFYEMYIAEQNMVGAALGFSKRGKIPFVSTFACFLSRAFDQIRMSQYADANIKFCGSHAGVSIGEDGASQMALEDIAMFRTVLGGVVLYPSDAVSTEKLVAEAAKHHGNVYIRTTRKETPIIYTPSPLIPPPEREGRVGVDHQFKIGGSCVLKSSVSDKATVVGAGVTLHEALAAYEQLKKEGINIRVIDLYSIKPLDLETLQKAAKETGVIITVEDHFKEGGLGEAVAAALCTYEVHHILESMAVTKLPKSGKPDELLAYEGINASSIVSKLKDLLNTN